MRTSWCRAGIRWLLLGSLLACSAAFADQRDPRLPALFEQLKAATTPAEAALLESQIWQHWHTAPSKHAGELMAGIALSMERRDYSMALALNNQLITEHEDYAEAWNKRATIHYVIGEHDRSVADISQTLALEPRHFGAISGLGLIFLQRGDLQAALDAFEEVLNISPLSSNALRSAEQVRTELGNEI